MFGAIAIASDATEDDKQSLLDTPKMPAEGELNAAYPIL